ncbi:MAG: cytochrome c1 [Gallionella sp.]
MNTLLKVILLYGFCFNAGATEITLKNIQLETDLPALTRGADALMNICHTCHTLKYIKYRDLINLGIDKKKVTAWRGEQTVDASLQAQMSPIDTIQAFGKLPPDLSLMVNAREGGAKYVYSYLLAYYVTPKGLQGNHIFPATKMPDPLGISRASTDAERAKIQSKARDIVSFLSWASDPHAEERIRLGYYVIAYLIVLTTLLYFVKRLIWSKLKK